MTWAILLSCAALTRAALGDGRVAFTDGSGPDVLPPLSAPQPSDTSALTPSSATVPLTDIPQLGSLPSAPNKVYLNFTGGLMNTWGTFNTYYPGWLSPYDQDGDPATFSSGEINSIDQIWARVAESFSPFNIDVTTVNPGNFTTNHSVQVMITNTAWFGAVGGIADVFTFSTPYVNTSDHGTVFAFPTYLANGNPKYVAVAAAHEVGHAFGLYHQSSGSQEYGPGTWPGDPSNPFATPGTGYKSPLMGLGYYADRAMWWNGFSNDVNHTQDDLAAISSNVFGYRPINANSSIAAALSLADSGGNVAAAGIIRKTTDKYYYSFTTPGGPATINMDAARFVDSSGSASVIGMLNSKLQLYDSSGHLIAAAGSATTNSNPSLDASLSLSLSGGVYYVAAGSVGNYGDVGQFTLGGSIVPPGPAVPAWSNLQGATIIAGGTAALGATLGNTAAPFNNSLNYSVSASLVSGAATLAAVSSSAGTLAPGSSQSLTVTVTSTVPGTHTIGITANDLSGASGPQTAAATLTVFDHANASFSASAAQTTAVIDFGHLLQGAPAVSRSFTVYNLAANTTAALTSNLKLTGFSVSGDDAFGTNLAAFANLSAGSSSTFTATVDTSRLTTSGTKMVTMAASQLADDSPLPGANTNNNGTLTLMLEGAVGAAMADSSNSRASFGPALAADVSQGGSYAGLQSHAAATTGGGDGGLLQGSSAAILAGTASAATNVQMAWRTAATGCPGQNGDGLVSDVVHICGLPAIDAQTHNGTAHTDVYVLQVSYDPTAVADKFGMSEADAARAGKIHLDYLDPGADGLVYTGDDAWQLAVDGNIGSSNIQFEGATPWNGDMQLGDYGVDPASHTVWAVVDHAGDFAVVPEPSALMLLVATAATWLLGRRAMNRLA